MYVLLSELFINYIVQMTNFKLGDIIEKLIYVCISFNNAQSVTHK